MSLLAGGAAPAPPAPPIKARGVRSGARPAPRKNTVALAVPLPRSPAHPSSDRCSVRLGRVRRPASALHAAGRSRRSARFGQNARLPARMASRAPLLLTGARVMLGAARPAPARPPQVQKHPSSSRPSPPHAARHGAARRPHRNGKTRSNRSSTLQSPKGNPRATVTPWPGDCIARLERKNHQSEKRKAPL